MARAKADQAVTESQARPTKAGLVMMILFLIFFLGNSDSFMISSLLPYIAKDFGFAERVGEVGGWVGPAYAIAAAVAALFVGPLSDRYGRRRFLLYAAILFGGSLLGVAFVQKFYVLAAIRLLTGLAAGTFSTCSIAYVADYFPYKRRGVAMSVVQAGYFGALALGVPAANLIAQWQSWRSSFLFFGLLSVVALILIATLLPEDKHIMAEKNLTARMSRRFDNIRLVFENIERRASIAAAFCVSAGFLGFFYYLPSWLRKSLNLKDTEVNIFFIVVGFALLIGAFVAGPVADKFGKRALSILSTLVLAAMLFVIPRFDWGALLFVCFFTASLAFAFRQGPLQALATELVPSHARGALVAVRNTSSQVGIAMATATSGLLYDRAGYQAVGIFSSVMTLAAAACIFLMREPGGETDETDNRS